MGKKIGKGNDDTSRRIGERGRLGTIRREREESALEDRRLGKAYGAIGKIKTKMVDYRKQGKREL